MIEAWCRLALGLSLMGTASTLFTVARVVEFAAKVVGDIAEVAEDIASGRGVNP